MPKAPVLYSSDALFVTGKVFCCSPNLNLDDSEIVFVWQLTYIYWQLTQSGIDTLRKKRL